MCRCRPALSPLLLLLPALSFALAAAPDNAPAVAKPQRSQPPPSPLDSPELAWLVAHDAPPAGPLLLRRITPKSVFVAPTFTGCSEGYRQDNMGRCVKVVKVNQAAQWDFFLQKLNAMYAPGPQASGSSLKPKDPSGPFHVSLSLAGVAPGVEETTESPDSTTVLTTRIASTTLQPSTTVMPTEQTESELPSSVFSTLETTPRTDSPIDSTTLTTTEYNRDRDTGKTSADSSTTVLTHKDVENVTKNSVTIEPSDNGSSIVPFVIVVANSSLDSSTTGAIVVYDRQVADSGTSETAFTEDSSGTVATGEMSMTEVYILEPSETTTRRTVDLVRPNLNIRLPDNVRSRCNLSVQVTQVRDGVRDALPVDCEPEVTTSRGTVVRFPSLVGDTGKGPSFVRFPESQTNARLRRPGDRGWDADQRPYWWPTTWDSPQQHPMVTGWSQPQQGSASFHKQYHQYSPQPLWQQPSWSHRNVFQRG